MLIEGVSGFRVYACLWTKLCVGVFFVLLTSRDGEEEKREFIAAMTRARTGSNFRRRSKTLNVTTNG